ncbi:MAG: VOC family protein, partial [Nitrososphaerales archaeon]
MTTVSIEKQNEMKLSAKITQVILHVENQSKSLEFYTKKIGFEKKIDFPTAEGQRWIVVGPKGQDMGIALQGYDSDIGKKSGAASMVIEVENCRKTYQELKSRGVEFKRDAGEELRELSYGIVGFFADPDGYTFELMQPSKALTASQANAVQKTEPTNSAKEAVISFIESLNNKDLKSARSYVSENFSMTGPGTSFD